MTNEIVEIGNAQELILGSSKAILNVADSPLQGKRETEVFDDE